MISQISRTMRWRLTPTTLCGSAITVCRNAIVVTQIRRGASPQKRELLRWFGVGQAQLIPGAVFCYRVRVVEPPGLTRRAKHQAFQSRARPYTVDSPVYQ